MKRFFALIFCMGVFFAGAVNGFAQMADLEDLVLNPESFWNGDDGSGGFGSNGVTFGNSYNADWSSWDGSPIPTSQMQLPKDMAPSITPLPGPGQTAAKFMLWRMSAHLPERCPPSRWKPNRRLPAPILQTPITPIIP